MIMAKSRFENAEQWNTKREIDRINRQIKQAYTKFGADSRLAKQYQTILQGSESRILRDSLANQTALNRRKGTTEPLVRYTKEGIPQISTGKSALSEFTNISSMQAQLKNLGRMQTVQTAQRQMIQAYEKRTGQKVTGRGGKLQAIQSELQQYQTAETLLKDYLTQLYEYEKKHGVKLQAVQEIRKLSKGRWTSQGELAAMIATARNAIRAESKEIIEDVFSQNQW